MKENQDRISIEELEKQKEQIKKETKEIENMISEKPDDIKIYLEKQKVTLQQDKKNFYISIGIILSLIFIINISLIVLKAQLIFIILGLFLTVPIFICLLIWTLLRLFLFGDFNVLRGKIIIAVSSNFIIANFLLTQKRIVKRVCLINEDGISFNVGKKKYTVDGNCIWLDENKNPNSFYVPNLPNPLKFDFVKYLKLALQQYRKQDNENFTDEIDVLYSSENLSRLKLDDYMKKMHVDRDADKNKMFIYIFILFIISIIAICVIVFFMSNKSTIIQVAQNTTLPIKQI